MPDQGFVFAFRHHPYHRFRARGANDEAALVAEAAAALLDGGFDVLGLQGFAALIADVLQQLRQRLELPADLRGRLAGTNDDGKHLQCRDQSVAGGRVIAQDDVPRLFAADVVAAFAHLLDHIAIANLGADQRDATAAKIPFETEVGHDGGNDAAILQQAGPLPVTGDQPKNLIAVDEGAVLVGEHRPVGIAIEGNAEIGTVATDRLAHSLWCRRAAVQVDVRAVRTDVQRDDLRAQLEQDLRRHPISGAIRAIEDDAQPFQRAAAGQRVLDELDVAAVDIVEALGTTQFRRRHQVRRQAVGHAPFNLALDLVGQLVAVGTEQLDAVILIGVVRSRQHHPEIAAHGAGENADRRRWHRPDEEDVHSHRDEAGGEGIFQKITGQPGILAHQHPMTVPSPLERQRRRHADFQRRLGGHRLFVGRAADPVGTEKLACHHHHPVL